MGAFFTNLHVASGAIDAIRAALTADAKANGMVDAASGEEPDRTVVLVPGERWTSVYDQDTESQDDKILERLGKALSKATGAAALSVLIHDSDVLRLALYEAGKRKDLFDSDPSYFGGRAKKTKAEDHVAAWRHLAPGTDETLGKVFGREELFAEAALPVLAGLLGIADGRLGTGYDYLSEEGLPADAIVLGWRMKDRPPWADFASGAPRLETQWEQAARLWGNAGPPAGSVPDIEVAVGGDARISATTLNAGGAGKGVLVEIEGDGLVEWHTIQLVLGNPKDTKWIEQPLAREGDRFVSRFPDAKVPPGLAGNPMLTRPADAMKLMEARFGTQVHVNVIGKALRTGRAVFTIQLTPLDGTGTKQAVAVSAKSTEDRPLRAPPGVHPMMVAPLSDRSRVVALVVLRPEALPRAGEVVQAVAAWFPTTGKVSTTIFPSPGGGFAAGLLAAITGGKPKIATGAAAGFLAGKRWTALTDAIASGTGLVQATWAHDPNLHASSADVFVGTGIIAPPDPVPAVALGIHGAPDAAIDALVAAIDGLGDAVIQAFVTRWGQTPGVDTTPYELACGVHGQCTLHRPWATRWLRGIGPGWLWLGPELRAHATVEGRLAGDVLRVEVRDLRATEAALASILPGPQDWQQGVMRRYGR